MTEYLFLHKTHIFTKTTCDILYLLSCLYRKVYIVKPNTSRVANSEKYIVCKDFNGNHSKLINNIISQYHKLKENDYITSVIDHDIDLYYLNKLEEYNAIFGQQQIENIHHTIALIDNKSNEEKFENMIKLNIQKAIQWCNKYNVPCNTMFTSFTDTITTK